MRRIVNDVNKRFQQDYDYVNGQFRQISDAFKKYAERIKMIEENIKKSSGHDVEKYVNKKIADVVDNIENAVNCTIKNQFDQLVAVRLKTFIEEEIANLNGTGK